MKKIKLLLHVGYAKTATTWMRRQVFPCLNNSIHFNDSDSFDSTLICRELDKTHYQLFQPLYSLKHYQARNSENLIRRYVDILEREIRQRFVNSNDISCFILSAGAVIEYSNYNGELNQFLLYRAMKRLREKLSNYCVLEISILVVFREQASSLQGFYAHNYKRQKDRFPTLEKFLDYGIKNHHDITFGSLWYDEIYHNLRDLFREDNLIFVPYELLVEDPFLFLEKSIGHLGNTDLKKLLATALLKREKVGRDVSGANKLKEPSFTSRVIGKLSMKYKGLIPERYQDSVKSMRDLFLKRFGGYVLKEGVKINNEQRKMIQDLYRDSNTRLAEMISVDLDRFGYAVNKDIT